MTIHPRSPAVPDKAALERGERRLAAIEKIKRIQEEILERRGGVPFTVEELDDVLRAVREGDPD
jgi:hypothetical protein